MLYEDNCQQKTIGKSGESLEASRPGRKLPISGGRKGPEEVDPRKGAKATFRPEN